MIPKLRADQIGLPPALPLPPEPKLTEDRLGVLPAATRRALSIALQTQDPSLHLFLVAPPELRLESDLLPILQRLLGGHSHASDLVFHTVGVPPQTPAPLELPAGLGPLLVETVEAVLSRLHEGLLTLPMDPELREQDRQLQRKSDRRSREAVEALSQQARQFGFGVKNLDGEVRAFPLLHGKPVSPDQYDVLDDATQQTILDAEDKLSPALQEAAARVQEIAKELASQQEALLFGFIEALVTEVFAEAAEQVAEHRPLLEFLARAKESLAAHKEDLLPLQLPKENPEAYMEQQLRELLGVHLLFTSAPQGPPPVLFETHPTQTRLFGSMDRRLVQGVLVGQLTDMHPGALLRASGGVLILRAADLLEDIPLLVRLKRSLRVGTLAPEEDFVQTPTASTPLRPAPAPFHTRVVLIGTEEQYGALRGDLDLAMMFRRKVDIEEQIPRTAETAEELDGFLAHLGRQRGWLPLDHGGREELLSVACELAEDRERFSLSLPPLEDTILLASQLAQERGALEVSREDIERAWSERLSQGSIAAQRLREPILRGEIFIDTTGSRVGVVNGLAVIPTYDVDIGQPVRITALVSPGTEGVIDVERESHLGGSLHTKGVVILRGLLGRLFGQERPFSLRAQIAFEQSYGEVDGDSASSSELFAMLSALADVGIKQSIAVTGSVNQLGEIQPIGGVRAKVEGFFDLCAARGLTGDQGVLLPAANLRQLLLRKDIVDAVANDSFHLFAVRTIAEGIEVLTGLPAGERDDQGRFPASSVFGRVERRLIELSEQLRRAEGGRDRGGNVPDLLTALDGEEAPPPLRPRR